MIYIRTKDGRILRFIDDFFEVVPCTIGELVKDGVYQAMDIIAKADTIEELCDEFVVVGKHKGTVKHKEELFRGEDGAWLKEIGFPEKLFNIYGAIWTDKGLIYVAKMNEDGELCLL